MSPTQLSLLELEQSDDHDSSLFRGDADALKNDLRSFDLFKKKTIVDVTRAKTTSGEVIEVETFMNEYWTSKQRAAHSLHEISYRACFKPQLPRFFLDRLTSRGGVVYDPFAGRGTTLLESALMGRKVIGCDVNPLSAILTRPRLDPPTYDEIYKRMDRIDIDDPREFPEELLVFYHPQTLRQICSLKEYFSDRARDGGLDRVDEWIRMVAINRLTGHSGGFFSVYSLPPNQAVSIDAQRKINTKRNQTPELRDIASRILKKSRSLLKDCDERTRSALSSVKEEVLLLTQSSTSIPQVPSTSVDLVVTSPPFLDVVNYAQDNWLRCWFCGIDPESVPITMAKKIEDWQGVMTQVLAEAWRVLKSGGHIAFEVGEVRNGKVKLEEYVIPCGIHSDLKPLLVLINDQEFTKTANAWGVHNQKKGTNTNRVVVFRKD